MKPKVQLTSDQQSYIAGFLDGDGCILAQIVRRRDYRFGFQIRVSIYFYQKTRRHWFILWLKSKLRYGNIRKRKDGMSEYCIVGFSAVQHILEHLCSKLRLKHKLGKLVLQIIASAKTVETQEHFIAVCEMVDEVANYTDSKRRRLTSTTVKTFLNSP